MEDLESVNINDVIRELEFIDYEYEDNSLEWLSDE